MFSVVIHKATRKPTLATAGLPSMASAIAAAHVLYEACKQLSNANVLASGVSILVLADADAEIITTTGIWPKSTTEHTLYQCGGY